MVRVFEWPTNETVERQASLRVWARVWVVGFFQICVTGLLYKTTTAQRAAAAVHDAHARTRARAQLGPRRNGGARRLERTRASLRRTSSEWAALTVRSDCAVAAARARWRPPRPPPPRPRRRAAREAPTPPPAPCRRRVAPTTAAPRAVAAPRTARTRAARRRRLRVQTRLRLPPPLALLLLRGPRLRLKPRAPHRRARHTAARTSYSPRGTGAPPTPRRRAARGDAAAEKRRGRRGRRRPRARGAPWPRRSWRDLLRVRRDLLRVHRGELLEEGAWWVEAKEKLVVGSA